MANNPAGTPGGKEPMVKRFERGAIWFHWSYAVSFVALTITGIGFLVPSLGFLMGPTSRTIHRLFAGVFMVAPIAYYFGAHKEALRHFRVAFKWTKSDTEWLLRAPLAYTLPNTQLPRAGFLNAGQKLNMYIVISTWFLFSVSGLVMWFMRTSLLTQAEREIFRWAGMLHSLSMVLGGGMFLIHLYLTMIHPYTQPSMEGMKSGYVPLSYARHEHPAWVEELQIEGGAGEASQSPGAPGKQK